MLIGELRPRTVIAIGPDGNGSIQAVAGRDGAAKWFADAMRALPLPANTHILSPHPAPSDTPGIAFHRGSARDPGSALPPELLQTLPRPWLVVADAGHPADATLAVLHFFDSWLEPNDYLVVERGNGDGMAGIDDFLADRPGAYAVDTRLGDWFGDIGHHRAARYLRRVAARAAIDLRSQAERRARNQAAVAGRSWFYEFELPDDTRTDGWPPEVQPIHTSRREKLRDVLARFVAPDSRAVAIDLAAHSGYFALELARHFGRVDAYELRPDTVAAARTIFDAFAADNATIVETDLTRMEPHPDLTADFVLMYGLLYHVEDPLRLLRLAAGLTRRHLLIETAVFPFDMAGRIDAGHYSRQRDVRGVFALAPDYPRPSALGPRPSVLGPRSSVLGRRADQSGIGAVGQRADRDPARSGLRPDDHPRSAAGGLRAIRPRRACGGLCRPRSRTTVNRRLRKPAWIDHRHDRGCLPGIAPKH